MKFQLWLLAASVALVLVGSVCLAVGEVMIGGIVLASAVVVALLGAMVFSPSQPMRWDDE